MLKLGIELNHTNFWGQFY